MKASDIIKFRKIEESFKKEGLRIEPYSYGVDDYFLIYPRTIRNVKNLHKKDPKNEQIDCVKDTSGLVMFLKGYKKAKRKQHVSL